MDAVIIIFVKIRTTHTHAQYTHKYTQTHTQIHSHANTHTHTHTHAHTHTHTTTHNTGTSTPPFSPLRYEVQCSLTEEQQDLPQGSLLIFRPQRLEHTLHLTLEHPPGQAPQLGDQRPLAAQAHQYLRSHLLEGGGAQVVHGAGEARLVDAGLV